MRMQIAKPGEHVALVDWPFTERLEDWTIPGVHLWGFPGWFVTRTYHLYQLPLLSRKLRVVVDWTVALLFRRDIVELSMLGHPHRLDPD